MKYKIALGIAVLVVVVFIEWLRHPLPILDGEIKIPSLTNKVDVYTDEYGVPHVYAETESDLFFAAGYIAARDRLFQLSICLLYTSPSPRDQRGSRMPSSA